MDVDDNCKTKTIEAIKAYQERLGMPYPDGLIELGNKTERALNGDSAAAAEHKGAEGETRAKVAAASKAAPTAKPTVAKAAT